MFVDKRSRNRHTQGIGRNKHILVVDDELRRSDEIRYALYREGYRVTCVASAKRALTRVQFDLPDLIVMKWILPGLDGLELCHRIHSYCRTPVLLLNVKSEPNSKSTVIDTNLAAVLANPFSIAELIRRVNETTARAGNDRVKEVGALSMVRSSKWLKGTKPEQSISEVAGTALRGRLDTVNSYARLVAKKSDEDIEYVHQFRVASRRARAALQIFSELLPKRQSRWIKKSLRELRRAAGEARDLDVLAERLRKIAKKKKRQDNHLCLVVKQVAAVRQEAQNPLAASVCKAKRKEFKKRSRQLTEAVRWQNDGPEPTYAKVARSTLAPLVEEFFKFGEADLTQIEAIHRMRIAGKQVRYAMELLAGAFDEPFLKEKLYPTFEGVQEELGKINDHATAINMYENWRKRFAKTNARDELARLIAKEEDLLEAKGAEFRDWWTAERVASLKRQFDNLLREAPSRSVATTA